MKSLDKTIRSLMLALGVILILLPVVAQASDLEEMLQEVGQEYAESYAAPFWSSFGPNLVSNLYSTSSIPWKGVTFGIGFKVMNSTLNEEDKTFTRVLSNVDFSDYLPQGVVVSDPTGDIVFSGPTIFGDPDTDGTIGFYSNGLLLAETEGISGLVETTNMPTAVPEIYVGGQFGLKATLRYLPSIELGDLGKTKFMGYGLQWSPNGLIPDFPVDFMAGFFKAELEIGSIFETKANSYFVSASKSFSVLTAYAGLAKEDSETTISYQPNGAAEAISFSADGVQKGRATVGATLGVPGFKLNAEVAKGKITTYSLGMMFGI